MRIAYIFTDLPDVVGTFPVAELEGISERGIDIEIFCLRSRLSSGSCARSLRRTFKVHQSRYLCLRTLGASIYYMFHKPRFFFSSLLQALRETTSSLPILVKTLGIFPKCCLFSLWIDRGQFEWIQAYWASLPGRAAWWISGFTGIPYGTWAHAGGDIYNRRHQTEAALKTVVSSATRVLTCNRTNLAYFQEILPADVVSKILFHPHGIDTQMFFPGSSVKSFSENSTRQAHLVRNNTPLRLLSVGRLTEAKGFQFAVRSCRILLESDLPFRYRIVGDGRERKNLYQLITALELDEVVELVGAMEHRSLVSEYHSADIYIAPSIIGSHGNRDGLPNVVLEAMACGLPVIGSDTVGIPEAVQDGITGYLVPPRDPNALAFAILDLAPKPHKRRELGHAGFRLVNKDYARHHCMDRLAGLYRSADTPLTSFKSRENSPNSLDLDSIQATD